MTVGIQTAHGILKSLRTDQLKVRDISQALAAGPLNKLLAHTRNRKNKPENSVAVVHSLGNLKFR